MSFCIDKDCFQHEMAYGDFKDFHREYYITLGY